MTDSSGGVIFPTRDEINAKIADKRSAGEKREDKIREVQGLGEKITDLLDEFRSHGYKVWHQIGALEGSCEGYPSWLIEYDDDHQMWTFDWVKD